MQDQNILAYMINFGTMKWWWPLFWFVDDDVAVSNAYQIYCQCYITLIWVGFLRVRFKVGGRGKITLCLKLVRIMLETVTLVHKYTHK